MSQFFFLLGRTPDLSIAELRALINQPLTIHPKKHWASVELASADEAKTVFARTGGSIKLCEVVGQVSAPEELEQKLQEWLATLETTNLEFGWTSNLQDISPQMIKKYLVSIGKSARYLPTEELGIAAPALLQKPERIDLFGIKWDEQWFVAHTLATQDIDAWNERDRHKPYFHRQKGMLPPKVARMMVNIATGRHAGLPSSGAPAIPQLVYDPFCGTGTILMEALELGHEVAGSDIDHESVDGTALNLNWLSRRHDLQPPVDQFIFHSDATSPTFPLALIGRVTAVVTEPFLGKQTPSPRHLPNIFKGLEKMYLGMFKQLSKVLVDHADVVIILPRVVTDQKTFHLESVIDKLAQYGYTTPSESVVYARPHAIVQRQIFHLRFQR
jgi:tRNA G10  N-methylase Trm11